LLCDPSFLFFWLSAIAADRLNFRFVVGSEESSGISPTVLI
jgi:hypothetical protein